MVATNLDKRLGPNGEALPDFPFELHCPDFPCPADVTDYTHDKLHAKLGKFARRLSGVIVHLKDINGDRGGVDKSCHMEARLDGLEPVNVEERHQDLRAAIDLAAHRLAEAVHRHLERAQSKRRDEGRKVVRNGKLAE
jgi:putative sigma-54 modulation protein